MNRNQTRKNRRRNFRKKKNKHQYLWGGIGMATIMDGKALSQKLKEQMKERIAQMRAEGIIPKLVVVLVGNDSASEVYVRQQT